MIVTLTIAQTLMQRPQFHTSSDLILPLSTMGCNLNRKLSIIRNLNFQEPGVEMW